MKILVVGSGGREHAITWRLAQDADKHELFCAPGNAGTAAIATNVAVGAEDNLPRSCIALGFLFFRQRGGEDGGLLSASYIESLWHTL